MGSQTLEILRQGVWASLTGGWFYDPHQGVFCNVIHLYLWLFLLCSPFVTYLYFPATALTWSIYCFLTSGAVLVLKVANMALHRLYDHAQSTSESNLKNPFFKITKNNEVRDEEGGIEMQVIGNDVPSRNSVEQAINEASEENSIMSMENANSILDLKVDVHRKNSSESIELMLYAPSVMSVSQQDQQSNTTASNSVSKSIRSSAAPHTASVALDMGTKLLTAYPEHKTEIPKTSDTSANPSHTARSALHLQRKSSEDFRHRHQRKRLERQNSLDVAAESALVMKLERSQIDTLSPVLDRYNTESFMHQQQQQQQQNCDVMANSVAAGRSSNAITVATVATTTTQSTTTVNSTHFQRASVTRTNTTTSMTAGTTAVASSTTNSPNISRSTHVTNATKTARLQRHRSSETHDERIKQQNRGLFLPIHHEHHHMSSGVGSSGALAGIHAADELELGLGGSAGVGANGIDVRRRGHGLLSLVFGSSSDVYLEDDSFTKSDLGIEQLDKRSIVLQQQQHPSLRYYQHQPPHFRPHHHAANIRKDSSSTMSALQLPVAVPAAGSKYAAGMKRRRHSNATSLYKNGVAGSAVVAPVLGSSQQPTVRRIKSAALEVGCPHPSVSNLVPHPNSVEAISGQQQIKNPKSALLPPPSKCMVRNPHLNLCPTYGGCFGGSASSLNLGVSGSGSTVALIDPVYPIVEQADEKASIDWEIGDSSGDLIIHDVDSEDVDDAEEEILERNVDSAADENVEAGDRNDIKLPDHNQPCCTSPGPAKCKSDFCQILDTDEYKDFDENLSQIPTEIQSDELLHAVCTLEGRRPNGDSDSESSEGVLQEHRGEAASSTHAAKERLHSSDSETDKNGSRSPLLSSSKGRDRNSTAAADKALMMEIASVQQQKAAVSQLPQHLYEDRLLNHARGEGDSGCPSSDCEQVSASSKDVLLTDLDACNTCTSPEAATADKDDASQNIEAEQPKLTATTSSTDAPTNAKSLGAIPKVVKYREVNETRSKEVIQQGSDVAASQYQLHKRRGLSSGGIAANATIGTSSTSKAVSRTSSSASSRSFSANSFSADINKMLWLMSGGSVDDTGHPVATSVVEDIHSMTSTSNVVPSSMSVAHFQFYQDALNALQSHPSNSVDGLSISERMYLRERARSSTKQISDAENSTLGEFPQAHELPATLLSASTTRVRTSMNGQAISAIVSSSTLGGGTRTSSSAAPLTIQGLINVINDGGRHGSVQVRLDSSVGGSGNNVASSPILNIESQPIENYCDYWRPACLLSAEKPVLPKSFYKYRFKFLGFEREFKISMDRLELLALFDRDLHWVHIVLSVVLAALVSYLGATILQLGFYRDLFAFLFCAVIAGSQYSLLKSVQPDAASPIHGFNKTVAYSRAIYFSCCGGLLLLLNDMQLHYERQPSVQCVLFGISFVPLEVTQTLLQSTYVLLLSFPLIFSLGLFPQINTFLMYFFEQIDMHVFGGNASSSLLGSFLCFIRSLLGVLILYGPLYASLVERRDTQYVVFSLFCAMLIPLGYHLSRSASDFSHHWALIKNSIVSTYRDDDDELSAATSSADCSSQKLTTSMPKQSKVDASKGVANNESEQIEMSSLEKLPAAEREEMANPEGKSFEEDQCTQLRGHSSGPDADVNQNAAAKKQPSLQTDDDKVSTSSTTNPGDISTLTAGGAAAVSVAENESESPDPLPRKLQNTVNMRLKNDFVVTTLLAVVVFGLHCSTVFSVLQPDLNVVLYAMTGALGLLLHYVIPQMRKHMPWLCFARPLLRQKEFGQFEVSKAAKVMWFEKVYIYLSTLERNVLFPLLVISALTADAPLIVEKFGVAWGSLIVAICALKFIRNAYSDPTNQYLIVIFTVFFFRVDFAAASETFLIDYFFVSIAFRKGCDFLLKLQFIVTYIAPWQITWGSAFHAFAQPFSVPHSAMLFLQAGVSALLSTPLNPFLGSAIFLTSYVRPIKFWERDYNTRRIDHSNTRLSSQLERDLGADDNNLNSIFYEHLTRSLQHSLCGDLMMGRWGNVNQGDCFVLASDYLNCLVHIIELGNGLCTFQMRGLEFRGTYCQQREVEAITEGVEDNDGCCCCDPGHLPRMLSANAMFSTRWLAWQVVSAQYVLEGYSISDNLASATLQVFEYRKVLITYYIKSIIYYVVKNPKLEKWLASGPIQDALQHTLSRQFVDLDPIFNYNLDEDFDFRALGISRASFCYIYLNWIRYCWDKRRERHCQANLAHGGTPSAAGDSARSTQTNLTVSQTQSQTQLRTRPQKSATMSGAAASSSVHSSQHMIATSQSFANISRQASESAPGLSGAGTAAPIPLNSSLDNGSSTVGTVYGRITTKAPQKLPKTYDRHYKHDSPTAEDASTRTKSSQQPQAVGRNSPVVSLCLALGLLARRSLATASHSSLTGVEFFLHGLHALFKGDFRITSPRDEWVFADMELLHAVVAPAVKMALKLQQDHISNPDEFLHPEALYAAISTYSNDLVISHEADPVWRSAVLRGASNLLALRHVLEDGSDEYRIIRLTKRFLSFRVIKLNRECVRGLWAGQQQELIYLRNRNPERGSIQNAKQALRNIINSSCDQPIGYPIYVSPLTTSYADTNEQLCQVIGGAITPETIKSNVIDWWHRVRERCRQGCSSGSALDQSANLGTVIIGSGCGMNVASDSGDLASVYISAPLYNTLTVGNFFGLRTSNVTGISGSLSGQYGSQSLVGVPPTRSGLTVMNKPISTTLLAGLLSRERELEREREAMRDPRVPRKSQPPVTDRGERERRATLPITSSCLGVLNGASVSHLEATTESVECKKNNFTAADPQLESSPRYTKISNSSGNLGIGNIITTPGEYPRKSKGPICLTAAAANVAAGISEGFEGRRKAPIDLFKKVIIVDGTEIYDCLDLGRHIDVVWPSEKMRANGGRLSWKEWSPRVGMVGYVVHYWLPNHADRRFRSHVNRILYLLEIGDHYVPIGEFGVREYQHIVGSVDRSSSRSSVQREYDERVERECLTPILGSSLESPTMMATTSTYRGPFSKADNGEGIGAGGGANARGTASAKIAAVSSSSSDDEELSNLERRMEMHRRDIINMMKLMSEKKRDVSSGPSLRKNGIEEAKIVADHLGEADAVKRSEDGSEKSPQTAASESEMITFVQGQEASAVKDVLKLEGPEFGGPFNESKEI